MRSIYGVIVMALLLWACRMTDVQQDRSPKELFIQSATGYDAENKAWTCPIENTEECSITDEQQKFIDVCTTAKYKVTRCTCAIVLCSNRLNTSK